MQVSNIQKKIRCSNRKVILLFLAIDGYRIRRVKEDLAKKLKPMKRLKKVLITLVQMANILC